MVVIGLNPLAQFLAGVVGQLARNNLRTFKNLEEGLKFLVTEDKTLPPLEELQALVAQAAAED